MKSALRFARTLLAMLLAGAALLAAVAPATARADTAAVAVNVRDGATVYRIVFQIRRVTGDTVDDTNAAVAYASCSDCQTVAISIQTLLVLDQPTVIAPENLALAMNVDCLDCQTLASAYQFLIAEGGRVHFTADGNRQIAEIRRALAQLRQSGLSIVDVQRRVDELMRELGDVLANDIVVTGPGADAAAASAGVARPSPDAAADAPAVTQPAPTAASTPAATAAPPPDAPAVTQPAPTAASTPAATAAPPPDAPITPAPDPTGTGIPGEEPSASPTPTETPTSTPEQTATPTPEQTATPTPQPTATSTP